MSQQRGLPYTEQVRSEEERYASTVMLLGYGGFFALWSVTHSKLGNILFGLCGLLMGISILLFVAFELFKTFGTGIAVAKGYSKDEMGNRRFSERDAEDLIQAHYERVNRWWMWFFIPSAITGLTAGFTLLGFFIWMMVK